MITTHRFTQADFPRVETVEADVDEYILSLPLCRGSVRIEREGRTVYDGEVRPGMLRVTAPGERFRLHRRSAAQAVIVSVPGPYFRRIAAERGHRGDPSSPSIIAPIVRPDPHVERLTSSLLGLPEIDARQRPMFLEGATLALLALAFAPRGEARAGGGHKAMDDVDFARCVDVADMHLDGKLDLGTWAAHVGLSLDEFVSRFQRKTRVAPYTWLLGRRIDRAKMLLSDPTLPLAEIALQVGFCSQSHFSEAFRRRTGLSPGRWRRRE